MIRQIKAVNVSRETFGETENFFLFFVKITVYKNQFLH